MRDSEMPPSWRIRLATALVVLLAAPLLMAAEGPSTFGYEGRLYDQYGDPSQATVSFVLSVLDPSGSCVLRAEESAAINLAATEGYFSINVGAGTALPNDPGLPLTRVFANNGTLAGAGGCSFTPLARDGRILRIAVKQGTTLTTLSPDVQIGATPYAFVADTLQGKTPTNFIQVNTASSAVTQANLEQIFSTQSRVSELAQLMEGTSAKYLAPNTNGTVLIPSPAGTFTAASLTAGQIWFDTQDHSLKLFDGTSIRNLGSGTTTNATGGSGTLTSITAGTGLSGGTITTSGTLSLAPSGVTPGTYNKVLVDGFGRVTSGGSLTSTDIPSLDWSKVTTGKPTTLAGYGVSDAVKNDGGIQRFQVAPESSMPAAGVGQKLFISSDTHKVFYDDGTQWVSLNGDNGDSGTNGSGGTMNFDWSQIVSGRPQTLEGYGILDAVKADGGIWSFKMGYESEKPTPGVYGRVFFAVDSHKIYRDDGINWLVLIESGTGGGTYINEPSTLGTLPNYYGSPYGYGVSLSLGQVWLDSMDMKIKYFDGVNIRTVSDSLSSGSGGSVYAAYPLMSWSSNEGGSTATSISMNAANSYSDGYLLAYDWNNFNNKLSKYLSVNHIFVGNPMGEAQPIALSSDFYVDPTSSTLRWAGFQGQQVYGTATTPGQVLKFDGNAYQPSALRLSDIRSMFGGSAMPYYCSPGQVLRYESMYDMLMCADVQIRPDQITGTGRFSLEHLPEQVVLNGGNSLSGPISIGSNNFDPLILQTNGQPRLLVTPGGRVGIGTSDPITDLQVRGTFSAGQPPITTTDGNIYTGSGYIGISPGQSAYGGGSAFLRGGDSPEGATSYAGQRGARVEAFGGDYNAYAFNGKGGNLILSAGADGFRGSSDIEFNAANGEQKMVIKTGTGNVGIGTTAPTTKLDVNGSVKLGTTGSTIQAMGVCTTASPISPTPSGVQVGCPGIQLDSAVSCSPKTSAGSVTISARVSAVDQVVIHSSGTGTSGVTTTFVCMWAK